MKMLQKALAVYLSSWLLFASAAISTAQTNQSAGQSAPKIMKQIPEELQRLVAPIALYPDALVSQILAGATYPTEIVEADRWLQDHPSLKGTDLADVVDTQPWDPSIKALSQFPSVLANMDKNLSWTSALGESYVNQSQAVMDAVQVMRARAQAAGNLKSNQQVKVETQEKTIIIEPAQPEVVYVPAYNPWIVYGPPVVVWPGWYAYPGLYVAGPGVSFGVGFTIGFVAGFGWGWHGWGCDWGHGSVTYNHNTFISNSQTFSGGRGQGKFRDYGAARGYQVRGDRFQGVADREHSESHTEAGRHSGAFSGYDHGGTTRGYSDRGSSSLHSGGFHEGSGIHGGFHH